jgi:hypothetical protein
MAEWQTVMTRVLALLVSLVVIVGVSSTPAVACVDTPAVGDAGHGCCGERTITSAPVGPCCFLSQPAGDRALTSSDRLVSKHHSDALGVVGPGAWFASADQRSLQRTRSASPPGLRTVPIYIQQSSLLI